MDIEEVYKHHDLFGTIKLIKNRHNRWTWQYHGLLQKNYGIKITDPKDQGDWIPELSAVRNADCSDSQQEAYTDAIDSLNNSLVMGVLEPIKTTRKGK